VIHQAELGLYLAEMWVTSGDDFMSEANHEELGVTHISAPDHGQSENEKTARRRFCFADSAPVSNGGQMTRPGC
jgi:hypothetical protein